MSPNFAGATAGSVPFPHALVPEVLSQELASTALHWLKSDAPWKLRTESFYEQYEFSLLDMDLPNPLRALAGEDFIAGLACLLRKSINAPHRLLLVDVSAHKLVPGQTIKVHNDFLGGEETHRFLIQLNGGWDLEMGGLLMLFNSDRAEDLAAAFLPHHGTGFAFEISPRSYHAVSTIKSGERFTLVYTFRAS